MIVDARELPEGSALQAKLCIIGGGMAAVAIAREMRGTGIDVLVLEAGGMTPTSAAQALFRGSATMHDAAGRTRDMTAFLPSSRIRAFGGSGHVWGGKCGPLDPSDFERREWVPDSGWPFDRATLDPFYDRASKHLELPSFRRDLIAGDPARPPLQVRDGRTFETIPRFHSPVTGNLNNGKFEAYRLSITTVPAIRVCINANATRIRLTSDGRAVAGVDVTTLEGKRHSVTADQYILASGAIENARLLLNSGVGNSSGTLGGYFAGHLNVSVDGDGKTPTSGIAFGNLERPFELYVDNDPLKVWGIWNATPRAQRELKMHNTWIAFTRQTVPPSPSEAAVQRLSRATTGSAPRGKSEFVPLRIMAEQPPTPSSRITLNAGEKDELGVPRVRLDWRLSDAYARGFERSVTILAREVGAGRLGRLRWPLPSAKLIDAVNPARHHVGTTRMSTDPRRGVVDADCRVHGVANLSIAGSSVFPTAGIVNPTYTLIALGIRLADTVRTSLQRAR